MKDTGHDSGCLREQAVNVVRQGVIDLSFDIAVKAKRGNAVRDRSLSFSLASANCPCTWVPNAT